MKPFENIPQSLLKSYSKLTQKKYRQSERKFLVEGVRLVEEALKSDWEIESIVISNHGLVKEVGTLTNLKINKDVELFSCSEKDFKKLTDTVTSQGIIAIVKMKEYQLKNFWNKPSKRSVIVALDDVADPGNVGTILRTCDWFGVDGVLLSKDTVDVFNPKVVRGTMGAIFHIPIISDVDLVPMIDKGVKDGFKVITTILDGGKPLNKFAFPEKAIIVFGNEARGVSAEIQNLSYDSITIPKYGDAESLNVAISCGIILNSYRA
ncbi:MAG: RNA methyltransferase [Ignavibacteriales bacterium]|nr:RNA methyltransferase [Ignavibacteriales bacterium]